MARQEGPAVPAPSMLEPIGAFDVVSADVAYSLWVLEISEAFDEFRRSWARRASAAPHMMPS